MFEGLLFGCPVGCELDECPFKKIREIPVEERIKLIWTLPADEKEIMIFEHKYCLAHRSVLNTIAG